MVGRYKGYFDRMQFQIEGATEETFDYDRLAEILSNQMFVGEYEELFNGFALVGATSMECFNDILRTFISRSSYAGELTDTMSTADMAEAVRMTAHRAKLEASGNMTLARIPEVAATGVDFISSGALTHSVKSADISMDIVEPEK